MKLKSLFVSACLMLLGMTVRGQEIVINEIMFHPSSENVLEEYIELHNRGTNVVNLFGWRISRGVDYTFTNAVIVPPGAYLVVAADVATFRAKYPGINNHVGGWRGVLSNQGEEIELEDASGQAIDSVIYADEGDWAVRVRGVLHNGYRGWDWMSPADGGGSSLELRNAALSNDTGQNWGSSFNAGGNGTPGLANSHRTSDIPPAILDVQHFPVVPRSGEPVTVAARFLDENRARVTFFVYYRTLQGAFVQTPLLDDGLHNDGVAGDGLYAAQLPGRTNGTVVEFYLEATDGDLTRAWPAAAVDENGIPVQAANLTYQVDDSVYPGNQPLYRLVLTEAERAELQGINRQSDAQMNATLILQDGTGTKVRYNVGVRIRGAGSRGATVPNYRVNIPTDRRLNGLSAVNLNAQYGHAQVVGSAISLKAGLAAAEAKPIQVRVNGVNLASTGVQNGFGSYALLEPVNADFAENHFPDDPEGNVYRASTGNHSADLFHVGSNPSTYISRGYTKNSNTSENDWTDLTNLTYRLDPNFTSDFDYVQAVTNAANVRLWMRYFALLTLLGYGETSLGTGRGDDYALYRGLLDERFVILPHDFDTILNQGQGPAGVTRDIFFAAQGLPIINRFMRHPEFVPIYFEELQQIANSILTPAEINPLIDRLLGGYVPDATLATMKQYAVDRRAYVLSQIPMNLTVTASLPFSGGYPQTTTSLVSLNGLANAVTTRSVRVNGVTALWNAVIGSWSANGVPMNPGLNRVLVLSLDAAGMETERVMMDIWFNDGGVATLPANIATTNLTAVGGPYVISGAATVPAGATMTMEAGTSLYFAQGATLTVSGRLVALGNETNGVRFTRDPAGSANWGGLRFTGTQQDNRISHAVIEFANTGDSILLTSSRLALDHILFTNTTQTLIELNNSSLVVRDSIFPSLTGRELIHGGPMPAGGEVIIERNVFGTTTGLNDIIDFTGAQRPGPVLQILGNVFTAASDDVLDLDGTDAHIEGNIFMHVHNGNFAAPDTSSAISFGADNGYGPEVVAVRNIFIDVDHVALAKEGGFIRLENNTALGIGVAVLNFSEPERNTVPGRGAYLDGNIFWNPVEGFAGTNFQNRFPTNGTVALEVHRSIFPSPNGLSNGLANLSIDPRLAASLTNLITYLTASNDVQLLSGSPARGTGPNGLDRGALVPAGATITGEPAPLTALTAATLNVAGPGIVSYVYRLNAGALSTETAVTNPIVLTGLTNGTYTVSVQGRNSAGQLQAAGQATLSQTWVVNTSLRRLVINEILARNNAVVHEDTFPDIVELYNAGGSTIDLTGIGLTDDPAKHHKFVFPAGTTIGPQQYLVLYGDAETTSGFHLGFGLDQEGDTLDLYDAVSNGGALLDSITFGLQLPNLSVGRLDDQTWGLTQPTFGAANSAQPLGQQLSLKINEWLADAQSLFAGDFVELYNPDSLPVAVGGLFLSDEPLGDPNRHRLADLSYIAAAGHLALIADRDVEAGVRHLNFQLAPEQGRIGLFLPDGTLIDCVFYDQQFTDVSEGRRPSGSEVIAYFGPITRTQPTPGGPNPGPGGTVTVTNIILPLLSMSSTWSYNNAGTDLATTWRLTNYNDTSWATGPALLGVETSQLPSPGLNTFFSPYSNAQPTYYFRTRFVVDTNLAGFSLIANTIIDDGAVLYINGAEALRIRMPAGVITYNTQAAGTSVDNASLESFFLPTTNLVAGTNLLAVEVHQATLPSSDVVLGVALEARRSITNRAEIQVVLNEVMANNETVVAPGSTNITDYIELYNPDALTVDLGGLSLSDDVTMPARFVFPAGTIIPGNGYLIVRSDNSTPASTNAAQLLNTGFGLSAGGDAIYLFDRASNARQLLDSIPFGLQAADFSIGRIPVGSGPWVLTLPTPEAVNIAASLGPVANLSINEWLANPSGNDDDFIEIFNANPQPVDLSGLFLTDDVSDRTKYKIPVLSFVGVGINAFALFFADNDPEEGADHTNFRLATEGETLGIYTAGGTQIDVVSFGAQANGVSEGRFPDGATNKVKFVGTDTPGESNLLPLTDVVVSEVLSHTDLPFADAIELQNVTMGSIDISGWYLSDDRNNLKQFRIPNGTVLPPGGFIVFYESQFNPDASGRAPSFALSGANGDNVYLATADEAGNLTGFRARARFGAVENAVSQGRYQTSVGVDFVRLVSRTFGSDNPATLQEFELGQGASNAAPRVGPVVINEIMYNPAPQGGLDNESDEFIELHNISGGTVSLFDTAFPTNTWHLRDAVKFDFPQETTMEAGAFLVVVGFDPATNATTLAAFRTRYGIPSNVPIFGPWEGKLSNSGDSVELEIPDTPQPLGSDQAGFVPYIDADSIEYSDVGPWASAADGSTNGVGISLQRVVPANYGNDPVNWRAGVPTPGVATGPAIVTTPFFTTQPSSQTVNAGNNVFLTSQVGGTGPLAFQWRFNGSDIPGANSSLLLIGNARFTNSGIYTLRVHNIAGAVLSQPALVTVQSRPIITKEPLPRTVVAGGEAIFSVAAGGTQPLFYQWYKDTVLQAGATNTSLVISNVQAVNEGAYQVIITNSFGAATSIVASLIINMAPEVTVDPQSTNIFVGANLTLSFTAVGTAPLRYQWRRNGSVIPGQTNSTLSLTNLQVADSASYTVQVINSVGSDTSAAAMVLVLIPPTLSIVATDAAASEPGSNIATFTITRGGSTNTSVTATLVITGSAVPNSDYTALATAVTIPAGVTTLAINVVPINDSVAEGDETVIVTLSGGSGYVLGSPVQATVIIRDEDNLPPSVVLTNPAANATFSTPVNILLGATASDSDGSITSVAFYYNQTNFIGQVQAGPYLFTWTNAPAGLHALTAVATDNLGSTTISAPVNITINSMPTVAIITPAQGANFSTPANINITATANDPDGDIVRVEFFAGNTSIATNNVASGGAAKADYQFQNSRDSSVLPAPTLTDLGANTFGSGLVDGTSRAVLNFAQNDGLALTNASSVISNNTYSIVMLMSFTQTNSFRRLLDFRNGASDDGLYLLDGALYFYPITQATASSVRANVFVQVALTRDASGNVAGYVNGVQQISFVDTLGVATLNASNVVRFFRDDGTGEASSGSIARLRIFNTALSAAEVLALNRVPGAGGNGGNFSTVFANVPVGNYILTARATDNLGAIATSAPVSITVSVPQANFADSFAARGLLGGYTNTLTGNNAAYTREAGEPRHDNRNGGHSGWISWTAPDSGTCTIDTFGSSFDTVLAVYTGEAVGNLVRVTSGDDSGASLQSQVSFAATAGVTYHIAVDGYGSLDAGSIVLHLGLPRLSPFVQNHPQDVTVNRGSPANFSVTAVGAAPLQYQWRFNGTNIAGANGSLFSVASAQATNDGLYAVVVSNAAGSMTSNPARLTVRIAPSFTAHPQNVEVNAGSNAVFTATVSGTPPFIYQWRYNGATMSGQTGLVLNINPVQYTNGGLYRLTVSSAAGSASSQEAELIVRPRLAAYQMQTNGMFRLYIHGVPGNSYAIEAGSNTGTWTTLGAVTNSAVQTDFLDAGSPSAGFRIYRLRRVVLP